MNKYTLAFQNSALEQKYFEYKLTEMKLFFTLSSLIIIPGCAFLSAYYFII